MDIRQCKFLTIILLAAGLAACGGGGGEDSNTTPPSNPTLSIASGADIECCQRAGLVDRDTRCPHCDSQSHPQVLIHEFITQRINLALCTTPTALHDIERIGCAANESNTLLNEQYRHP